MSQHKNVKELSVSDVSKSLKISGITTVKKSINKTAIKRNREGTKSFKIDKHIYDHYEAGEEFVTGAMSAHFREQGWLTSDVSGQLYAKQKSGLLINRKPNEDEAKLLGKGIRIWQATSEFYDRFESEIAALTESSMTASEGVTESSDVDGLE